jgi:hypothetical protein
LKLWLRSGVVSVRGPFFERRTVGAQPNVAMPKVPVECR